MGQGKALSPAFDRINPIATIREYDNPHCTSAVLHNWQFLWYDITSSIPSYQKFSLNTRSIIITTPSDRSSIHIEGALGK